MIIENEDGLGNILKISSHHPVYLQEKNELKHPIQSL